MSTRRPFHHRFGAHIARNRVEWIAFAFGLLYAAFLAVYGY